MGYSIERWRERIAQRVDFSSQVLHFTRDSERNGKKVRAATNLRSILSDQKIRGSSKSGFIVGDRSATCFQDAPLYAACQNVYFEQQFRKSNPGEKIRYQPFGLMFRKEYVYAKGGRPVLYEKTNLAKKILPREEWWRIVNFNMSKRDNLIDWTHEREWRCPGDFDFELDQATLLFVNASGFRSFCVWDKKQEESYLESIKGVVVLNNVLV